MRKIVLEIEETDALYSANNPSKGKVFFKDDVLRFDDGVYWNMPINFGRFVVDEEKSPKKTAPLDIGPGWIPKEELNRTELDKDFILNIIATTLNPSGHNTNGGF